MVTSWPMVKHSFSKGLVVNKKLYIKRGIVIYRGWHSFAPKLNGSHCDLHMEACYRFHKTSLSATDTLSTIKSTGSYGPSGRTTSGGFTRRY